MIYLFSVAAGLVGGFAGVLLLSGRRPRRRREGKQSRRKIECSKLVLWAVLCTYFAGFGVGVWAVVLDASQLGVFLAYVGTPTATVIGFYSWQAKAEKKKFIERVGALATADMQKSGVLASLTIAQAILESGWGKSGLTVKGNALFGIKAGTSWTGAVYSGKTQECYDGVTFTTVTGLFRAYGSWAESVADHSDLL